MQVIQSESKSKSQEENSMQSSTCKSDIDEDQSQVSRLPRTTKTDLDMLKRLNEKPPNDSHRASVLSDNSIPALQTQLPVKSMDVSDIGFRERY
jgi:hypothetical protein